MAAYGLAWLFAGVLACGAGASWHAGETQAGDAATAPATAPSPAVPSPTGSPGPAPASRPRLGLWVLCEGSQRVLEHPERVPALLDDAAALGATDLFVQVYRGGRAWFDSSRADAAPFAAARDAAGEDPLRALIAAAHARGLRVHAWVNVLSLAANRAAPVLRELGPGAVQVDRRGRSVLDYPGLELPAPDSAFLRVGTPAIWLDPAAPGVAAWLAATFAELVSRYPELDGLQLDYLRHPDVLPFSPGSRFGVGLDFGYGDATRARFTGETGLAAPSADSTANANEWDAWRRAQVTAVLRSIRDAALAARPGLVVSAAVWAQPARAYLSLFQDWPGWIDDGLLEFAVPMVYTTDERLLAIELASYRGLGAARLWAGLGVWLFAATPERAAAQLRAARAADLAGAALFSWDALSDSPALRAALAAETARDR
jgi:uncharacterized lipoprotein YddW (UPF0748 family)